MTRYNVVFSYSVIVEADDEHDAEDKAWIAFGKAELDTDYFAAIVDEVRGE